MYADSQIGQKCAMVGSLRSKRWIPCSICFKWCDNDVSLAVSCAITDQENPWPRDSSSDYRLDWAPVSAMAETSAWTAGIWMGLLFLRCADWSIEMVIGTRGCSRRRARFHSPFEKMWWSSVIGWLLLVSRPAIWEIGSDSIAWTLGDRVWGERCWRCIRQRAR